MYPNITILGAGTIGMSWTALFLASGRQVTVYDPATDLETKLKRFIANAAPALRSLGWENAGNIDKLYFDTDPASAAANADFIQESIPERLALKHQLYRAIEPVLKTGTIVATSTSGLNLSALQQGFRNPAPLILGHPFNPPHLIPLVEVMGNARTAPCALEDAQRFYHRLGKECVVLRKEIPGHIANRLQAALWRESIHLAKEGVASLEDIDKAVAFGPGLRWAALGPNSLFHLGGGSAGIEGFCQHLGGPFQGWWDDLGQPTLDEPTVAMLKAGMVQLCAKTDDQALATKRDQLVLDFLQSVRELNCKR